MIVKRISLGFGQTIYQTIRHLNTLNSGNLEKKLKIKKNEDDC